MVVVPFDLSLGDDHPRYQALTSRCHFCYLLVSSPYSNYIPYDLFLFCKYQNILIFQISFPGYSLALIPSKT